MFSKEFVKPGGDVVWRWEYQSGDTMYFMVGVLTRAALLTKSYGLEEGADAAWDRLLDSENLEEYAEDLEGKNLVVIPLADVTRVQGGINADDLPTVTVSWDDDGVERHHEMPAADDLPVFQRLRERLAPKSKIKKGLATVGSRLWAPAISMGATLVVGCGCCFPAAILAVNSNPYQGGSRRAQALRDVLLFVGPIGMVILLVLAMLGLAAWMGWRVVKRPPVRYFEVPRRRPVQDVADAT